MTIVKSVVDKAVVGFVAAAMVFSMFAPAAQAQSTDDLQKMIDDLMKQVAALQGQGGTSGSVASGICPFSWTRDLKTGATGADVMKLQQFLNSNADTRVSASGAGSVGMETEFFGPATAAAVSKFQVMHRADILTPAGLVNPTGFFGPSTRTKANSLCVTMPDGDEDEDGDTDEDEDEDENAELSGEASLSTFEIADGDDASDVEEGSEDIVVGELTVEFDDGDAEISRLDLALEVNSGNNGDDDPWKVFQEISLWVDGEEVARMDISDKDEYLDEDDGSIRFTDLGIVAMEDEELIIDVAVTVNSSVDGVGTSDVEGWNIAAGAIRFFDADGVATTETTFGDLQDITGPLASPIAEFDIEEAGAGDDLDLEASDDDLDATTLFVDEDDNVERAFFVFDLSAEDSDGDMELTEISVNATITGATNIDDLVNDFRLEIDGQSFDADSYVGTNATVTLVFDIDNDVTIAADEVLSATLYADFEDMESGDEGSTIVAGVYASGVEAEGVESGESVTTGGSYVQGETHTVRTEGVAIEFVDDTITAIENSDATTTDNEAKFVLEFDLTASGDTIYIPFGATASTTDLNDGIVYSIVNTNTNAVVTTGSAVASFDADFDPETNAYRVSDGATKRFTLEVEYDPSVAGSYKVRVDKINYATSDVALATTAQTVSAQNVDTAQTSISQ